MQCLNVISKDSTEYSYTRNMYPCKYPEQSI
jgi:hypothetical protein